MGLFSGIRDRVNEARENRHERQESRRERRHGRISRRKKRRSNRAHNREERIEFRRRKHSARVSKREDRFKSRMERRRGRGRGKDEETTPEQEKAMDELEPMQSEMSAQLDEQGIDHNPDDLTEVATKYAQTNTDIPSPTDEETYNDAYVNVDADFESNFDKETRRAKAKDALKAGLSGVAAALDSYTNNIEKKPADQRTPNEQALLDAKNDAITQGKKDYFAELFPLLAVVLGIIILMKVLKK